MFYKVFVKTKLKIDQPLIYKYNTDLEIGDIVLIPLGKNHSIGVIVNKFKEKPQFQFQIKNIIKNLNDEYIKLNIIELKIIKYLIQEYNATVNNVLPLYLTPRLLDIKTSPYKNITSKNITLTNEQNQVFNRIINEENINKHILFGRTGSGKTEIYIKLIKKYIKNGKQVLLLIPDISLTSQIYSKIGNSFDKNEISVIHSKISKKNRIKENNLIRAGEKKIIIGARSAIFSRFDNLGLIIIDEFQDASFKQEKDPRYDCIKLAEYLTSIIKGKILLGSATPRIDIYYKYLNDKKNCSILKLKHKYSEGKNLDIDVKIIDLQEDINKNRNFILSKELKDSLLNMRRGKDKALLYINRRGFSPIALCKKCLYINKCPRCEIPLNIHLEQNRYAFICHHCEFRKSADDINCPICKNDNIKFYGFGTQTVKKEIDELLINNKVKLNTFVLDKDSNKDIGLYEELSNVDIIIGTQIITKGWDFDNVTLIGILNADLDFSFPDYRGIEDSYEKFIQIIGRTGRKNNIGKVIIQTYNSNNPLLADIQKEDFEDFFSKEIEFRKRFKYPPFSKLIKITIKSKNEYTLNKKAIDFYNKILRLKTNNIIYYPSNSYPYKKNYIYRKNIIIKILDEEDKMKYFLRKELSNEKNIVIDIDPINLS